MRTPQELAATLEFQIGEIDHMLRWVRDPDHVGALVALRTAAVRLRAADLPQAILDREVLRVGEGLTIMQELTGIDRQPSISQALH